MDKGTQTEEFPARTEERTLLEDLEYYILPHPFPWADRQYPSKFLHWFVLAAVAPFEVLALLMTSAAVSLIALEESGNEEELTLAFNATIGLQPRNYLLDLGLGKEVIDIIMTLIVFIGAMWWLFSILFIIGVLKNKVNYVMSYFLFGCAICIVYFMSSLLEAINGMWVYSVATMASTAVYVRCLMFVYSAYDKLLEEKDLDDREQLVQQDDINTGE